MADQDKKKVIGYRLLTGIIVVTQFISGINNFVQPEAYQEMFTGLG